MWFGWLSDGTVHPAGNHYGGQAIDEHSSGNVTTEILQMDECHESVEKEQVEVD